MKIILKKIWMKKIIERVIDDLDNLDKLIKDKDLLNDNKIINDKDLLSKSDNKYWW